MTKSKKYQYTIISMFILYFIILIIERTLSIVESFKNNINIFSTPFNGFVYLSVFISIGLFLIYLVTYLFTKKLDLNKLVIASGILLISGMVHTEYTNSILQFISYGFLIIAILMQTIINQQIAKSKLILWLSFIYLIFYSMAIPVSYPSNLSYNLIFHILEGFTSYLLVIIFTKMTYDLFNQKEDLFNYSYLIITVILDGLLIGLRWIESINYFVLIFVILTLVTFIIGTIIKQRNISKTK